jgi:hypothetical protein
MVDYYILFINLLNIQQLSQIIIISFILIRGLRIITEKLNK